MLAAVMNGRGNGNTDEVISFKERETSLLNFFFLKFLTVQVGTMSTGEKDEAGRPMGTIIASTRGMIIDRCFPTADTF